MRSRPAVPNGGLFDIEWTKNKDLHQNGKRNDPSMASSDFGFAKLLRKSLVLYGGILLLAAHEGNFCLSWTKFPKKIRILFHILLEKVYIVQPSLTWLWLPSKWIRKTMEFLHTMLVFKCLLPEGDQMASCKNGILVWFQSITLVKNLDINCDNPTYPLITRLPLLVYYLPIFKESTMASLHTMLLPAMCWQTLTAIYVVASIWNAILAEEPSISVTHNWSDARYWCLELIYWNCIFIVVSNHNPSRPKKTREARDAYTFVRTQ